MPYNVVYLVDPNTDAVYDQTAFGAVHPNGDSYVAVRRNTTPKEIVIMRITQGTGDKGTVVTLKEGTDFSSAGPVNLDFHPLGHIIVYGIFKDKLNWSPGYIVVPNMCPPFTNAHSYTVTQSAEDSLARSMANSALDTANQARSIAQAAQEDKRTNGKNAEASAMKKLDEAIKNMPKSLSEKQVKDIAWEYANRRIFFALENEPNSPLMNNITQAAIAAVRQVIGKK